MYRPTSIKASTLNKEEKFVGQLRCDVLEAGYLEVGLWVAWKGRERLTRTPSGRRASEESAGQVSPCQTDF
jgi:hypothetical protein